MMINSLPDISQAEIEIMRVVWHNQPLTSRQIIDTLIPISDWKEGTIKSLINRLIQKDWLIQDARQRPYIITSRMPAQEVLWDRIFQEYQLVCTKERGQLLYDLINETNLNQEDCQKLKQLIEEKSAIAPQTVTCQCPKGQCTCHTIHKKE